MLGLTPRQADAYEFIRGRIASGRSPSFREIKDGLGLKSTSGVERLVAGLAERGAIVRMKGRARTITLPESGTVTVHGYQLSRGVEERLRRYCKARGLTPAEIVELAVDLHLEVGE